MSAETLHGSESPRREELHASTAQDPVAVAVRAACARIAPAWPLDRSIAVNPLWQLVDAPLSEVAAKLRSLSGAELLMPRAFYRDAYRRGELRDEHLKAALEASGSSESVASLRALLDEAEPPFSVRARVIDVVDRGRDLGHAPSWRGFVVQSISQFCAAFFDEGQAMLGPQRGAGLFAAWRHYAQGDRSPAWLMGAADYRSLSSELPQTAWEASRLAIQALGVPKGELDSYLWSLLLDVNGWAAWCAYRRWIARLDSKDDVAIEELLAIRLAWEWILYRQGGHGLKAEWASAMASWPRADAAGEAARARDWLLQSALETAWRVPVLRALSQGCATPRVVDPAVQAVFCIDVRSEVMRRALEASSPSVQTLGFAGFFGLPLAYAPFGTGIVRPQLPGLLAPRLRAEDTALGASELAQHRRTQLMRGAERSFKSDPVSTFAFVDALGITYAGHLAKACLGFVGGQERAGLSSTALARRDPRLVGTVSGAPLDIDAQADLAQGMLRGMSLTCNHARLVLLVGHGSASCNNPHAAGLDCGACCGQTGEVNARVGAALLNDPEVRRCLNRRGLCVPDSTRFVAALHNTTTDEIELFELEHIPDSHRADLSALQAWLSEASVRARAERSRRLGISASSAAELRKAIDARTRDWSQIRPEWGLANNAALIIAPREHSKHVDLEGRSFLHEYRHAEDHGYAVLEQIMTAPMVVAHWINFQYYASTVDNVHYGSGNKVLHNVVGGHIGVFEGNTGDLRIGLPLQSLHDGKDWVHTPLRLTVIIEAPRSAIDGILAKHSTVRALVVNRWLSLFQLDEEERAVYALHEGAWRVQVPGACTA